MKINFSSWLVNIIGAIAYAGIAVVALNSPALPKTGVAYIIVLGGTMFFVALGNAVKASVVPSINAQAVLDHSISTPPASVKDLKAVAVAKETKIP